MKTLRFYSLILFASILGACSNTPQAKEKACLTINTNHFPNIIKVEQYGDTMRLEVEKRGDTLVKHYIDLKGTSDDNFDNSFSATCTYERRNVDSIVVVEKKKLRIQAILIENYITEFSGGKYFYFITQSGDTVLDHHFREWIR